MEQKTYLPEGKALYAASKHRNGRADTGDVIDLMHDGVIIEGKCILCDSEMNLYVDFGYAKGIIPGSECVFSPLKTPVKEIAVISKVGRPVCFKVKGLMPGGKETENIKEKIGMDASAPLFLLSRREAQKECMENYVASLSPGDIIDARVTHLENFGCFVDIGCGIISLLSIDTVSVSRISHPKERFYIGQDIKVVVKSGLNEYGQITITHKELLGTWEQNAAAFSVGQTAVGIVRSIESYGVFVELAPNFAGLAELKDGVEEGQSAAVFIKNMIPEKMKVKLVIIDSYPGSKEIRPFRYYAEGTHIDRWRYSPQNCVKTVETVF